MCCGDNKPKPKSKRVVGWRVYYPNEVYSSRLVAWTDLPTDDVQVVMQYFEDGTKAIFSGYDYYFWQPPDIWGANNHDSSDNARRYPTAVFLRGKHMEIDAFSKIQDSAMESRWP